MIGLIKKINLNNKQAKIKRLYPGVNVTLHSEMPMSAINAMVYFAGIVDEVNKFQPRLEKLSNTELCQKTAFFREHIAKKNQQARGEINELKDLLASISIPEEKDRVKEKLKLARNKIFAEILPEAFAVVREASYRSIGLRHFDVQVAGGLILHEGKIAEMATGEGKTLVATMPVYLNALLGKGVHVVTVNDYLARRDREWMGPIYEFLGLSVGVIQHGLSDSQRKAAYGCDITYGTNNEFGFDYLRDNMKYRLEDLVQRGFYFAVVDEVDSILIDEARTPLIISGATEESTDKYYIAKKLSTQLRGRLVTDNQETDAKYKGQDLTKGFDYIANEKSHSISLTEEGEAKAAKLWGVDNLHSLETMECKHHITQALRAKEFFKLDREYIVKDGQVVIVDEFTGRLMPGRRWSDGQHQAIEAKEGLKIEQENQTLATITFQNYFRMYEKLSGMTGTAYTEAVEFKAIYKLDVVTLPTNQPLIRVNYPDLVYKTEAEKFNAVVEEIIELHNKARPVLVGTITIDRSEALAEMLKRKGIPYQVLNAKFHEMEAQIVAQAGRFGGVTIATNMAGRGTDILLGGNADFMAKSLISQRAMVRPPIAEAISQRAMVRLPIAEAISQRAAAGEEVISDDDQKLLEKYKKQTAEEHRKVVELGGLHVLGTQRHEARRIDNQLRGRCGRQGDPGSSRFYVSFEDDLMRMFAPEWIIKLLEGLDTGGEPLTLKEGNMARMISKSIETAQRRVEQHNFEIRKQLLEYDNVMSKQREVIYNQRRQILEGAALNDEILSMAECLIERIVDETLCEDAASFSDTDSRQISSAIQVKFGIEPDFNLLKGKNKTEVKEILYALIVKYYQEKEKIAGAEMMRYLEQMVFLQIVDSKWKDHLYSMDKLREGIGLRAYGQKDPLIEYKNEAFNYFNLMISGIEEEALEIIFKLQPAKPERFKGVFSAHQEMLHPQAVLSGSSSRGETEGYQANKPADTAGFRTVVRPIKSDQLKVGRNDPCSCGSGKKYKKCCGK